MTYNHPLIVPVGRLHRLTLTLTLLLLPLAAKAAPWEEKYYNPDPQKDDIILPMPCEGSMAFRKVQIPLEKPLEDYPFQAGQEGDDWGYLQQTRPDHIAGSFTESEGGKGRYYLIGKYEVTRLQYAALMDDKCPAPNNMQRLPQVEIGWVDAINFTDRYNLWLRKNAAARLPVEEGVKGFLRLPTESEWEFAARGGLAVSPAQFRDRLFPMPEGPNAYVWFSDPQSANGKLQLSGLLKANPLGIHDILGNAAEMTFEPFRLNKLDRQHGQAGGMTVRGGSFITPLAELGSALRLEQPYYVDQGQNRSKAVGMRLAITAPALPSRARIQEIEKEWQTLGANTQEIVDRKSKDDSINQLNTIRSEVQDDAIKQQLAKLRNALRANAQLRDEQRDQAIRANLQLGAFLCSKLKDDGKYYDFVNSNYEKNCKTAKSDDATCSKRKEQVQEHARVLDFTLNYYADSLVDSGMIYTAALVKPQMEITRQQMQARSTSNLQNYMNSYWKHLQAYWKDGKVARTAWLEACKKTD